jgi:hypothetical protein
MYNPLGGWTIGRVWEDPNDPDASKANFPEGTVAVKPLFVEVREKSAKMRWFKNIKRQPFDGGNVSLDYSLQLRDGIKEWCDAENCDQR